MFDRFQRTDTERAIDAVRRWAKGEHVSVIRSADGYRYAVGLNQEVGVVPVRQENAQPDLSPPDSDDRAEIQPPAF